MKQLQDLLCWADSPCSVNSELSNCCYIQRGSGRAHVPARAHTQPSVLPAICTGTLQSQTRLKLLSHTASCAPLCALCSHISAKAQAAEDALKPPGAVRVGLPKSHHIYIYMFTKTNIYKSQWLLWISEALLHRARWRSALNASSTKTCFKRTAFCWALFFNPRTVYTGRLYLCERRERHLSEQDAQTLCASYKSREHLLDLEHVWC